ncbi:GNAT family N-acetyltransferase [Kribbella sp. NBC_00359]|uniref:GNAT family N-acetyltransferase n=1 Tax=Kribbella sp. NBC_00359 TaxID=2975966 RepID=UPI003FA60290
MVGLAEWTMREYTPEDETPRLRCRVIAFLDTTYYDDVVTIKPRREAGLELVAIVGDQVVGLLDASVTGSESTIETIAVHPDDRRLGIAQRLLPRLGRQRGCPAQPIQPCVLLPTVREVARGLTREGMATPSRHHRPLRASRPNRPR